MAPTSYHSSYGRLIRLATAYDRADDDDGDESITFELPEDLTSLSDEDLEALAGEAQEAFDALYGPIEEGGDPSAEDVAAMQALADAAEAIRGEEKRRDNERQENRADAEALAARMRPGEDGDAEGAEESGESEGEAEALADGGDESAGDEGAADGEPDQMAASSHRRSRVTVPAARSRQPSSRSRRRPAATDRPVILASAELGGGLTAGEPVSTREVADALVRKTQGMTPSSYEAAYRSGRRVQNAIGLLSIQKNFPDELVASADNAQEVIARAVDESRLPGGSLVASGGWCSPSETVYDLFELEQASGLVSVPEFQVSRGGIRFTPGPDFSTLFGSTGFCFNEEQDTAGEYGELDGEGNPTPGEKPCFKVDCPDFTEERLEVCGLCITAGILQNRAYPEVTERTIRGALVGHQHRLAGNTIEKIVDGSDAVTLAADQVGATAPLLTAIELQVSHYRYVHRMGENASLEAIFPLWVRGVIRSDLSRRLGVDLLTVSNQQIAGWFSERGVSAQFVYNYQDLTGDAGDFVAWPSTVQFLLYAAGTWTRGTADVISLDAIFDSALLKLNDFTALFSEEGWLLAKRGHDSRKVTVPICADGSTHGGVLIDCDGSAAEVGGE